MVTFDWLQSVRLGLRRDRQRRTATRVETLEPRMVLATDFGDAPDTGAGTGAGNYETSLANNGPRHTIVAGLFLGARVDGEADGTPNVKANGDDIGTDDEDGVVNPEADLRATAGTQPTIALRATNTTGTAATLYGWIDANGDGVFDNATERAQLSVPTGTNNGLFTLTLPTVPAGFFGKTYARFRLSTDVAGGSATGLASDGEVEDFDFSVMANVGDGTVKTGGVTKIATGMNGGPTLVDGSGFGGAVANLGDFDGDGVNDLAVGAPFDSTGATQTGAVYILLQKADGTVKSSMKIASGTNGGPTLEIAAAFGSAIANLGDIDGDGVTDIAIGASGNVTAGTRTGAVYILRLNANGTVKATTKIASETNGGPSLQHLDMFGDALASMGDIDGDGITDVAVGSPGANDGDFLKNGVAYLLRLNPDGTVKLSTKVVMAAGGKQISRYFENFGTALSNLGDVDGDGFADLAVGASGDGLYSKSQGGSLYILRLNAVGLAKTSTRINGINLGAPTSLLSSGDRFGSAIANIGDIDGDGVTDLAVGAKGQDGGGADRGALYVLRLNANDTVKTLKKTVQGTGIEPVLMNGDSFGASLASPGDIDGDGIADLVGGAIGDDSGGQNRGAVYVVRLSGNASPVDITLSRNSVSGLSANILVGTEVGRLGTVDPNSGNTFTYTLATGTGSTDNASFTIVGDELQTNAAVANQDYSIRIRTTDQGGLFFEKAFTITVSATNTAAPVLDTLGNPFAVLGVGGRQSVEMRQGSLVSEILARGAGGDPISDADAGAQAGIAITAFDASLGTFQYTLVANNPQESDWKNFDADGAVTEASALLLPRTARVRFVTALVPHHVTEAGSLPLESKLATGLTFRAWDLTAGLSGGRADTTTNGGTTAFSTATETATVYFEARMWRSFNTNAQLNVYTLEKEFNALVAIPGYEDRSTSAFTGFSVLLSAVPELSTAPLFRMYFGVQFNDDGTETDMGYRYLTPETGEAGILEGLGKPEKRPTREGAYFRELGVNSGTAILGYVYTTQQPGTSQLTQIYRTDRVGKPTRPGGTAEGSTPTSTRSQEQGDHVYTTNTAFETGKPGTWRVERARGFARELTPNPTAGPPAASAALLAPANASTDEDPTPVGRRAPAASQPAMVAAAPPTSPGETVARLVAMAPTASAVTRTPGREGAVPPAPSVGTTPDDAPGLDVVFLLDDVFASADLVAAFGLAS